MPDQSLPEGVERYDFAGCERYTTGPNGAFVRYDDHHKIVANRNRIIAALQAASNRHLDELAKIEAQVREAVETELTQARRDLRYHEHHERKAIEELDGLGVEKFDSEDRMDSTDDSAGQEWSIYMRIRLLARKLSRENRLARAKERERFREAVLSKEAARAGTVAGLNAPDDGSEDFDAVTRMVLEAALDKAQEIMEGEAGA